MDDAQRTAHLDELELGLLMAGGVDNWEGYGEALAGAPEGASAILFALRSAGVDNWEWYGEALKGFSDYCDYVEDLPEGESPAPFADWTPEAPDSRDDAEPEPAKPEPPSESALRLCVSHWAASRGVAVEPLLESVRESVWKRTAFPTYFEKALALLRRGKTIEDVRLEYLRLISESGELESYLARLSSDS